MSRYGAKRSPPDARDYKYRVRLAAVVPVKLPPAIDYTTKMTGVRDQENEGACVGFASAAMKEFQEWKQHHRCCKPDLSERYIYERAKLVDGDPLPHEGTTIRAAMEILRKHGVCKESCWRYKPNITGKPCRLADTKALPNRILSYVAIDNVLEMKQALVSNGPFVIGIDVYTSIDTQVDGFVPDPRPGDIIEGGHAICIVGYDDAKHAFKFKNSWSASWGDHGYGYLSYEYMAKYSYDGWLAADL